MKRIGKSDKKLLQELYNRAGAAMNGGNDEVTLEFGKMAAEFFGESLHQSMPGYDDYRSARTARRVFADFELCCQMTEDEPPLTTYEIHDRDIVYVDETLQEYGTRYGNADAEEDEDPAGFLMLSDALRCAIDPKSLRIWMKTNEGERDAYQQQVGG